MAEDAHKDNPLSNPADYAHYISRMRSEVGKLGTKAKLSRPAPMAGERAQVPKAVVQPGKVSLKNQIHYGPLRQWMRGYALWLISQSPAPGMEKRSAKIAFLSKHKAGASHVRALECRVDFQQYMDQLGADAVALARAQYEEMFPLMTEAQRVALEAATQDPKMFKSVSKVVEGMTERVWPRKAPESDTKKVVHIHLTGAQSAALASAQQAEDIPEAEITLIEPPPAA